MPKVEDNEVYRKYNIGSAEKNEAKQYLEKTPQTRQLNSKSNYIRFSKKPNASFSYNTQVQYPEKENLLNEAPLRIVENLEPVTYPVVVPQAQPHPVQFVEDLQTQMYSIMIVT